MQTSVHLHSPMTICTHLIHVLSSYRSPMKNGQRPLWSDNIQWSCAWHHNDIIKSWWLLSILHCRSTDIYRSGGFCRNLLLIINCYGTLSIVIETPLHLCDKYEKKRKCTALNQSNMILILNIYHNIVGIIGCALVWWFAVFRKSTKLINFVSIS